MGRLAFSIVSFPPLCGPSFQALATSILCTELTFPEDGLDLGLALQHVHEDAGGRPGGGLAAVLAAVLEADVLHDEAAEVAAAAVPRQLLHLARLPAVELEDLNTRLG